MSYYQLTKLLVAFCFGFAFALVCWWEIVGSILSEEWTGSAVQWVGVASATLLGCAILVGATGALFAAYEEVALRRLNRTSPLDMQNFAMPLEHHSVGIVPDHPIENTDERRERLPRGVADRQPLSASQAADSQP